MPQVHLRALTADPCTRAPFIPQVLSYLHSLDILNLARTNKDMRRLLMSKVRQTSSLCFVSDGASCPESCRHPNKFGGQQGATSVTAVYLSVHPINRNRNGLSCCSSGLVRSVDGVVHLLRVRMAYLPMCFRHAADNPPVRSSGVYGCAPVNHVGRISTSISWYLC